LEQTVRTMKALARGEKGDDGRDGKDGKDGRDGKVVRSAEGGMTPSMIFSEGCIRIEVPVTINVPERDVTVNAPVSVPAPAVTVVNSHPAASKQLIERDAHGEISKTTTTFQFPE